MLISFPTVFALDERRLGNPVRQIAESSRQIEGTLIPYVWDRVHGFLFQPNGGDEETLILPRARQLPSSQVRVIEGTVTNPTNAVDLRDAKWIKHPVRSGAVFDHAQAIQETLKSWL